MTLYLLLPFLILCSSLVANFVDGNAAHSTEPRADRGTTDIRVNFTLRRIQGGIEDNFCNVGVDIAGNITVEVFYRVRDGASVVGNWKRSLQTISSGILSIVPTLHLLGPQCVPSSCMHVYYTQGLVGDLL